MRRYYPVLAFVGALFLLSATPPAEAQKKDNLDPKDAKTSPKMIKAGQLVGTVKNIYESKKALRISVTVTTAKLNVNALNGIAQARQAYAQALARRPADLAGAQRAQMQLLQHQANLYTYENKKHEVELTTTDEVEVRMRKPKPEFDEKGNVKKFTKKELKELKGDPKKPGYKADFSDVQPDQVIRVQLVKKKDAPRPPARKGKKDDDIDPLAENLPQVSWIMIEYDPAWAPPPPAGKKGR
jgi:hypothetical protein